MSIAIIGGGAAGMMAAIAAAGAGAEVTIIEKNPRMGKKLLVTGNGRCNYTNINIGSAAACGCYHGADPSFVREVLARFDAEQAISFFERLGVAHKVEEAGKVFPRSDQASSVLDVLRFEVERLGVRVFCQARVLEIRKGRRGFALKLADGSSLQAERVILATGGRAMPVTGSAGDGYTLAGRLGHTIVDVFPALVPLKLEGDFFKGIAGVKSLGTVEVLDDSRVAARERGDLLFTNYGISGPPVLQVSRKANELLRQRGEARIAVRLFDNISGEGLARLLQKRFRQAGDKSAEFSLVGLVNKRLIPVLLRGAGVSDLKTPAGSLSEKSVERLAALLTGWIFRVTGNTSWPNAQVTAGGVATREINPSTMESLLVKGFYLAGEVVDVDGDCGGYNLQWAWSSGYVAGRSAAVSEVEGC